MLPFFPPDVLDENWDLIESVSGGFLTYSCDILQLVMWSRHSFAISVGSKQVSCQNIRLIRSSRVWPGCSKLTMP